MYKYFKELDTPDSYSIYLETPNYYQNNIHYCSVNSLNNLSINYDIFEDIKFIDKLVVGMKNNLGHRNLFFYECETYYEFLNYCSENGEYIQYLKNKINLTFKELESILQNYLELSKWMIDFFPNYQEKLNNILKKLANATKEMRIKSTLLLPNSSNNNEYNFPNAWFITPNGYLYNTGGSGGHKEGNLIYPFHNVIELSLFNNQRISKCDNFYKIKDILNRGYVTQGEFSYYSNLIDELPTILTPEVELEQIRYNNILNLPVEEVLKLKKEDLPKTKRSYQKNIITLVIGHLSAESTLFESFSRLNDSQNKRENMEKIDSLTNSYIPDILVRYSGFYKIESQVDKMITSSSLYSIDMLKAYLDKGWNLQLIPGIVYDKVLDQVTEVDFHSYYIEKYLDEKLKFYRGKGKILIKK